MGLGFNPDFNGGDTKMTKMTSVRKAVTANTSSHSKLYLMKSGSQPEVDTFIYNTIETLSLQDAFYVLDLGLLIQLYQQWVKALPRVMPFYAVKCSPDPALLSTLADLGTGFDCASKAEIAQVLALGVPTERILFANPCKMQAHVKYAASVGVNTMTFDSEMEVHKVKACHPNATLLLRIRTDDRGARCPLGVKYGALMSEVEHLLCVAHDLHVPVTGVSFHIGSGATDANSFTDAIAAAREVFDIAKQLQLPAMKVLDIGGGFTAGCNGTLSFLDAAAAVNAALDEYFPPSMDVTIIAEPGRYFAESPSTLATTIIGKRVRGNLKEYWINDGIYGSMNCLLYDHAELKYRPLLHASLSTSTHATSNGNGNNCTTVHNSTVFGPTCDGLDTVLRSASLPDLAVGDWLVFPNMGAYTAAAGSSFNGFATSDIPTFYVFSNACNPGSYAYLKSLMAEDDVVVDNINNHSNNHNLVGSGRQIMCTANDGFS